MGAPAILICVGAAKAGTSWLYRTLHDRTDCSLPAVKELHYWDTFDGDQRDRQIAAFEARLADFASLRAGAMEAGRGWQVRNMDRRSADMTALIAALGADRSGDRAYLELLDRYGAGHVTADITPAYALQDAAMLGRMVDTSPRVRILYLIRDPLARLWSHVRMQADRQKAEGQETEQKANGILRRILNKGHEGHLTARGDYAATIQRLRDTVPSARLMVAFLEELVTPQGYGRLCAFLGLPEAAPTTTDRVHAGPQARMRPDLRLPALAYLKDQYDWVARHVAPLPPEWAANYARVRTS